MAHQRHFENGLTPVPLDETSLRKAHAQLSEAIKAALTFIGRRRIPTPTAHDEPYAGESGKSARRSIKTFLI
jgi:hypothetical protein